MKLTFNYTGKEALEAIQEYFPETWMQEVEEARRGLEGLKRIYKMGTMDAYNKFLRTCGSPANGVVMLAATYLMHKEETKARKEKLNQALENLQKSEDNIEALKTSKMFSEQDRHMLTRYFTNQAKKYRLTIDEIVLSLEVFNIEEVEYQKKMF